MVGLKLFKTYRTGAGIQIHAVPVAELIAPVAFLFALFGAIANIPVVLGRKFLASDFAFINHDSASESQIGSEARRMTAV